MLTSTLPSPDFEKQARAEFFKVGRVSSKPKYRKLWFNSIVTLHLAIVALS